MPLEGESISIAFVGVNKPENRVNKKIKASCDLGGQPDSIAVSLDKTFITVAIENERDEEVREGVLPQTLPIVW